MADEPRPLEPLVGNLWVPVWALRPGSYRAIADAADAMPLWLVLHSRNGDAWKPCYATREQLGATLGFGRAKVSRQLEALRSSYLLFEVDRGVEPKTQRRRALARWALDPFAADLWRGKLEDALQRVAEDDGHDGRWYQRAVTSLDAFERRSRIMGARIGEDMPIPPAQQRKRRRKGSKPTRGPKSTPGSKMSREGRCFTRGVEAKPSENGKRTNPPSSDGPCASQPRTRPAREGSSQHPNPDDPENIAADSAVDPTRDTAEVDAARGVSGVRGPK